ncbi:hypothetical protein AN396_01145 [Candidatus Epulonipiscium fishelsonii]|uniref:Uncharacterized protein n=1 Tax=Candidatus Epulonipiscium fishelsonii TaxID=77094 RepID=A0ACC8XC10_9FIRM|nr:hypothetical protein AN396_01145 [Epulopiscium sp. SCG-B11WGA-EpuloA1]
MLTLQDVDTTTIQDVTTSYTMLTSQDVTTQDIIVTSQDVDTKTAQDVNIQDTMLTLQDVDTTTIQDIHIQDIDTKTAQDVNIQDTMLTAKDVTTQDIIVTVQDVTTQDTMLTLQDVDTTTIQDIHIQDIDTKTVQDVNTQDIIVTIQDVTTLDTMLTLQDVATPYTNVIEQDVTTSDTMLTLQDVDTTTIQDIHIQDVDIKTVQDVNTQDIIVTIQDVTTLDTMLTLQDVATPYTNVIGQDVITPDITVIEQDVTTSDTMLTLQDVDTTTIQDIHIQDIDTKTVQDVNTQDIIVTIQDVTTPDTMLTIQDVTTPDTAVIEQDIATLNTNVIPQKYVVRSEVSQENTTNNEGGVISDIMEQNVSKNITKSEYGLFDKLEINVDDMYNTALKLIQVKNSQEASTIKKLFLKAIPYTYMNGQLSLNSLPDTLSREFDNIELHSIISNLKLLDLLSLYNIGKEISLDDITASEFVDISMHWAENSINEANKNGFIGGVTSDLFAPEQELYVADTFTFLDRLLLSNNVLKMNLPRETVEKYVPNKMDWTFYHVASIGSKLSENTLKQVMSSSEDNITRGMFAQILFEITDKQLPKIKYDYNFIDIDNSPYNEAITYCIETGLLCGISQNEMAPNKMLTRAELAAVLVRLDEKLG